jgi:predicted AlkP superfamily pyrophosphatase or phosphodiesterase
VLLAVLVAILAVAAYRGLQGRDSPPDGVAEHVVLVVFDTLRADRMSIYGHPAETTPYLEQASGDLLRYGSVRATAPWTIPSHASMLTGLWPSEHRAQWGSFQLEESRLTLAEILSSRGFCTVGLSANSFVSRATGLDQGFDAFKVFKKQASPQILREAAGVLDHARDCGRLFLFINRMDTHVPYTFGPYADAFGVSRPPIRTSRTSGP